MSRTSRFLVLVSLASVVLAALQGRYHVLDRLTWRRRALPREQSGEAVSDESHPSRFDWTAADSDGTEIEAALRSEGIDLVSRRFADSAARASMLRWKLAAVGMHFDEEPGPEAAVALPLVRFSGTATAVQLARAIEGGLAATTSGLSVDTTANVVEVDQQWDLARGEVVVLEPHRSFQLRAGTRRVLLEALQEKQRQPHIPGAIQTADLAQLRHELADLPDSLDQFLSGLRDGRYLAYFGGERVRRLGTARACERCGSMIVDVAALSQLLAEFYGAHGRRQEIADGLMASGLEIGDRLNPRLCRADGQSAPLQ
jgi:hypothetical protein